MAVSRLQHARDAVAAHKARAQRAEGVRASAAARAERRAADAEQMRQVAEKARQAGAVIELASRVLRSGAADRLQQAVTAALEGIFGEGYACSVDLAAQRGVPVASFRVRGGGYDEPADPRDARGGGLVDVVALSAKLAVLEMAQPGGRGLPLIADEPADALDRDRAPELGAFLQEVSELTGRQIIFVTHNRQLAERADLVVEIR